MAADTLRQTTYDQLVEGVALSELTAADIYPLTLDSPAELDWPRHLIVPPPAFFQGAAASGDAMLLWLD